MSDSTESSAYFYRIISLVVYVGTETLRDMFYSMVPKKDVSVLFGTLNKEFDSLKKKRILTKVQYNMVTDNPDPDTYDISLFTILLTNLKNFEISPPAKGWAERPDAADLSIGADLLRLREVRNEIVGHHTKFAQLNVKQFKSYDDTVSTVLIRIAKKVGPEEEKKITQMIKTARTRSLETSDEKLLQMQNMIQKSNEDVEKKFEMLRDALDRISKDMQHVAKETRTVAERTRDITIHSSGDYREHTNTQTVNQGLNGNFNFHGPVNMNINNELSHQSKVQPIPPSAHDQHGSQLEAKTDFNSMSSEKEFIDIRKGENEAIDDTDTEDKLWANFARSQACKTSAFIWKYKAEALKSVCRIRFQNVLGTGFRVGSKYLMTAAHVLTGILHEGSKSFPPLNEEEALDATFAEFDYLEKDSTLIKFKLKGAVFTNEEIDVTILELQEAENVLMRPPFKQFKEASGKTSFNFIGHPEGDSMKVDEDVHILDMNTRRVIRDTGMEKSERFGVQYCKSDDLENDNNYYFHTSFTAGASGSPGVYFQDDGSAVVVTMLTAGYPKWYYEPESDKESKAKEQWEYKDCVEVGVSMKVVYDSLKLKKEELCKEIFPLD